MEKATSNDKKELSALSYVIGGMSFIPILGIVFGLIAIIHGLGTSKLGGRKLAILGSCGIAVTLLYSGWVYYSAFGNEDFMAEVTKDRLTSLVQEIEFYKINNGRYPTSLEILQKSLLGKSDHLVYEPSNPIKFDVVEPAYFHYALEGDSHYYLLGVGSDQTPYTNDDVLPNLKIEENSGIGLKVHSSSLGQKT